MTEYIKRDDVLTKIDKLVKLNEKHGFPVDVFDIEMMKKMIKKIPAMDVVPIIRCKDCKYFNNREHQCENMDVHCDLEGGAQYSIGFDVDDFCSYGERKEE